MYSERLIASYAVLAVLVAYRSRWSWRTPDGLARRSLQRLGMAVLVFAMAYTGSVAALRQQFRPVPYDLDLLRGAMARLTFTSGVPN